MSLYFMSTVKVNLQLVLYVKRKQKVLIAKVHVIVGIKCLVWVILALKTNYALVDLKFEMIIN